MKLLEEILLEKLSEYDITMVLDELDYEPVSVKENISELVRKLRDERDNAHLF